VRAQLAIERALTLDESLPEAYLAAAELAESHQTQHLFHRLAKAAARPPPKRLPLLLERWMMCRGRNRTANVTVCR
jgi:hypothetical protein